ncbi:HNH endonuclease [Acinetobacter pecorum]|uniref:HNH endonuclease n=1 Tax=Acinetobacter pecorum TaxID=2762215 RepID=A0ABR8VZP6_9GAMM|nr:HNH endonuclease [Acinetobacter pecorum]MBD8010246.1 HNH endonuclease [Acinetobacter pecorum]
MASRNVRDTVQKKLFGDSANWCNLCSRKVIGLKDLCEKLQMAHIIAFADDPLEPRYVKGKSGDNSYENLILVCPNHHAEIDDKSPESRAKYTIEYLKQIKKEHEDKIKAFKDKSNPVHPRDTQLITTIFDTYDIVKMSNATQGYPESIEANIFEFLDLMDILETKGKLHYPFKDDDLNFYFENIKDNLETLVKYRSLLYKMNLSLEKYHLKDDISDIDLKCLLPIEGHVFGNENLDFVCTALYLLELDKESYSTNDFFNKLRGLPQLIKTITGDFNGLIRYYRVTYQD